MSTVYQYCKQLNGEKEGSRVLAACISDSTRTKKVIHKYVHIYIIYTVYAQYIQCVCVLIYMICNMYKESVV